jgi:TolB-like protein
VPAAEVVAELAGAILDGTEIDWTSVDSSAGVAERPLLAQLKLLAAVADLHRRVPDSEGARFVAATPPGDELQEWGPLRVLERIGHGAFGQVYRAWDTRLDREVALKLLPANPADVEPRGTSIVHEGRLLARVRHPHVVTIYGAERIDDRIGFWMEFVEGRTLEQVLDEDGAFGAEKAIDIGIQLCHAVSAVHDAGLLHRDIKAQNVMLTEERRLVLMDFGTGRDRDSRSAEALAGTPLYLAPELIGREAASVRSDIYSIGVLLYHLLTGSYPVRAASLRDLRTAHERRDRTGVSTTRPDLAPALCRIIERAIDPEPARRYDTAASLGADLAELGPRGQLKGAGRDAEADAPHASRGWQGSVGTRSLLAVLVAGAIAAPLYLRGGSDPRPATPLRDAVPLVAVLPFKSLGPVPVEEYLQLGMADAVITRLSGLKTLAVRPASAAGEYIARRRDPIAIGRRLGVDHVVDATVQHSGDRVRITAQLVEVASGRTEWAETFDESAINLFALQDAISTRIAGQLVAALTAEERRVLARRPTANLEAYELYLRGRFFWEKRSEGALRTAIGYFEQALQRDAQFALAYAGLVHTYATLANLGFEAPLKVLPALGAAALKAVEFDDQLAEAHTSMASFHSFDWNWPAQEAAYKRAFEANPNYPTAYLWYGFWLDSLGRQQENLAMRRRAYELDPLNLQINVALADTLYKTGHEDDALKQIARTLELDPEFWDAHHQLGLFHLARGRYGDAIAAFEKSGQPASIAHAYAMAGDRNRARVLLRRLEEESARRYVTPLDFAVVYAGLRENERAFAWLERAFRERVNWVRRLDVDVRYAPLRGDVRYADLLRRIRTAYLR